MKGVVLVINNSQVNQAKNQQLGIWTSHQGAVGGASTLYATSATASILSSAKQQTRMIHEKGSGVIEYFSMHLFIT
jgi:hypothetical protein